MEKVQGSASKKTAHSRRNSGNSSSDESDGRSEESVGEVGKVAYLETDESGGDGPSGKRSASRREGMPGGVPGVVSKQAKGRGGGNVGTGSIARRTVRAATLPASSRVDGGDSSLEEASSVEREEDSVASSRKIGGDGNENCEKPSPRSKGTSRKEALLGEYRDLQKKHGYYEKNKEDNEHMALWHYVKDDLFGKVKFIAGDEDLAVDDVIAEQVRVGCFPNMEKGYFQKRWLQWFKTDVRTHPQQLITSYWHASGLADDPP